MASKYYARKTVVDGITFDSKHEAERYQVLKLLERAGKISGLRLQVEFELIPAQYETFPRYGKHGKRLEDGRRCVEKSCSYYADFVYHDSDGNLIVEDVKSPATRTDVYKIKKKLMLMQGIKITEV